MHLPGPPSSSTLLSASRKDVCQQTRLMRSALGTKAANVIDPLSRRWRPHL